MPNRILHERICVSETVAELSAEEERFFYRLIVQCDDYGRFDGRASVIRARCFALQLDRVSDDDVAGWLARLEEVGLVVTYVVDGRVYLRVTTWERYQQTRAKRSKFPAPEDASQSSASTCDQVPAYVPENREPVNEKREARSELPPSIPPSGGDAPPTPRKRGARNSRVELTNGVHHQESEPSPSEGVTPVTTSDREVLNQALAALRAESDTTAWKANTEALELLVPIGRAPDGGLHLRAPPGRGLNRFRNHVARALLDAGDPAGPLVLIVEGPPGESKG